MPQLTIRQLMAKFQKASDERMLWKSTLEDAYDLALPMRNLLAQRSPGELNMEHVYDSTLMNATSNFANTLQSELFPPESIWAELVPGKIFPDEQTKTQAREQLEPRTKQVFSAIQMSNFDTVLNEALLDLAVGTSAILMQPGPDDNPVNFIAVPALQLSLEEGPGGSVGKVFREHEFDAELIEHEYGEEFIKPDGWEEFIRDRVENTSNDSKVRVVEATYADYDKFGKPSKWYFEVVLPDYNNMVVDGESKGVRIVEREMKFNPWIVTRWVKVAGEVWGRGPVMYALADAKTLNKTMELLLMAAALDISGVWTAIDDGVLDPDLIEFTPGTVIPVEQNGGARGPSLQRHNIGSNIDLSQIILDDLRVAIKKKLLDIGLPDETTAVRSATEVVARIREIQRNIGAPFGRIMVEMMVPIIQNVVHILADKGIMPRLVINRSIIDIQVASPLAKAEGLGEVQNVVETLEMVAPILGLEGMALVYKLEELGEWIANRTGFPASLVRQGQERSAMQNNIAQMIASQAAPQEQSQPAGATNGSLQPA